MAEGDKKDFTDKTQWLLDPPQNATQAAVAYAQIAGFGNKLGLQRREIVQFGSGLTMSIPQKLILTVHWSPLEGAEQAKRAERREALAVKILRRVLTCDSPDGLVMLQQEINDHLSNEQLIG